ncbi:unnamed protein product [Cyprideis torosa]|uniref:Uncharacterized protein n=1 Tax=Cyprideis torosa TaxID=163714 RepID=A0A7R8ZTR0_9CRUS|nr:unnamed protein product [Cyprideis torosa]CAG0898574.1 unnamed protein product [Cyprideis torosa]
MDPGAQPLLSGRRSAGTKAESCGTKLLQRAQVLKKPESVLGPVYELCSLQELYIRAQEVGNWMVLWRQARRKNNRWPYYDKWGNGLLVYGTGKGELKRYKVYKPLEGYYRR